MRSCESTRHAPRRARAALRHGLLTAAPIMSSRMPITPIRWLSASSSWSSGVPASSWRGRSLLFSSVAASLDDDGPLAAGVSSNERRIASSVSSTSSRRAASLVRSSSSSSSKASLATPSSASEVSLLPSSSGKASLARPWEDGIGTQGANSPHRGEKNGGRCDIGLGSARSSGLCIRLASVRGWSTT